jgi:chorismate mutase / prephenate dehydrogenase
MNLDELRTAITELDGELIELVARRQALSEQVAAVKRATGKPTRDFGREREVILRARTAAKSRGVSPALAESILRQLIQSSLATQEQAGVAAQAQGSGKRALVIGGRGKMGHWFADFLASQGFRVAIADPAGRCRDSTTSPTGRTMRSIRT